ncbi:MAG: hypothetical protein AAF915_14025 [Cyanobacteria bacterium P01_D01_bin.50]
MKNKIFRIVVLVGLCFLLIINPDNALANKLPSQIVSKSEFSSLTERTLQETESNFNIDFPSNISLVVFEEPFISQLILKLITSKEGRESISESSELIKHVSELLQKGPSYLSELTEEDKQKIIQIIVKTGSTTGLFILNYFIQNHLIQNQVEQSY